MRSRLLWATALALLLGALHTVRTRLEVVEFGRAIGRLENDIADRERRNANLVLGLEQESSPARLMERMREAERDNREAMAAGAER